MPVARSWAVSLLVGLLLSLALAVAWYLSVAQWYVETMTPVVEWLLSRCGLGPWRVELVLLHLANWIPFVALAAISVVRGTGLRTAVLYCIGGLLVIVAGHILLSVYMNYLYVRMPRSPLFAYLLIIGFSVHDLLPFAMWVKMAKPEWLTRIVRMPAGT